MTAPRLNGWWRLWIVLSVLYVAWAYFAALPPYPSRDLYFTQAEIANRYGPPDSALRASLIRLAESQSAPEQLRAYRWGWYKTSALVVLFWPVIGGLALLTAAWVRRGFSRRRLGVRVVEAEIEDP
jgi:hypothetical protein